MSHPDLLHATALNTLAPRIPPRDTAAHPSQQLDTTNVHKAVRELDAAVKAYDGSSFSTSLVDGTPATRRSKGLRSAPPRLPSRTSDIPFHCL